MKFFIAIILLIANNSFAQAESYSLLSLISEKITVLSDAMVPKFEDYCLEGRQVPSCLAVGKYYDLKKEESKGQKFYQKSCQLLSPTGCLLGGYNLERQGKESQSNDLYLYGCYQLNDAKNCLARGQNYREERNWVEALNLFTLACEKDLGQGCFFASEMVTFAGHNYKKNNYLLMKGCKLSHPSSCYSLARYAQSTGDLSNARWAYQQACINDILEACEEYRIINSGGMVEKLWQKNKLKINQVKDSFLNYLEKEFPIGPSSKVP